ncbi:hypothetical protein [Nocardioides eburneiflavus]|nr:hypothetical protein [Nocardioides eburneiflavus]
MLHHTASLMLRRALHKSRVKMVLPVWLRIMNSPGTGHFNFKVVR